jgi:membrane-associated phospholipid phosphatase
MASRAERRTENTLGAGNIMNAVLTRRSHHVTHRPVGVRLLPSLILLAIGAALLVLSALPVHEHSVAPFERSTFHAINRHTIAPFIVVWTVMQLGNIVVIPLAAAAVAVARRWWLALAILLGGGVAYELAKVVKSIVVRGRPADLLADVHVRGAAPTGRGYLSGHAAVVSLLAVLIWPYLSRPWRIVVCVLAAIVCLARIYVGAHLPLDIVGGIGLGIAVAAAIRIVFGRRVRAWS